MTLMVFASDPPVTCSELPEAEAVTPAERSRRLSSFSIMDLPFQKKVVNEDISTNTDEYVDCEPNISGIFVFFGWGSKVATLPEFAHLSPTMNQSITGIFASFLVCLLLCPLVAPGKATTTKSTAPSATQ